MRNRQTSCAVVQSMELLEGRLLFAVGGTISGNVETTSGFGIAGVTVYLDANNNRKLDSGEQSTTTNSAGAYSFSNVPAGAFIVRQILPSGETQVTPSNGYGNHLTVTAGSTFSNQNFVDNGSGVITGTVYDDANGDGKQDDGETGLAGWLVYLDFGNVGHYVFGEPVPTTNAAGQYSFTVEAPGDYIVRVMPPANYTQVTPTMDFGHHPVLAAGGTVSGENFGFTVSSSASGSISGTVTLNGAAAPAGWFVYLDANNNGVFDRGETSTITLVNGAYQFSGLAAGNYIVRVVPAPGYEQVTPASDFGDHVALASGAAAAGENFVFRSTSTASISGTVFDDTNGDGIMDDGETGIAGVTVYLDLNNSGSFVADDPAPVTDADGNYIFTDLPARTFIVRVKPGAYTQTWPTNNLGHHVTLADAQQLSGVDFGEKETVATPF